MCLQADIERQSLTEIQTALPVIVADGILGTETFWHEERGPCTTGSGLGKEEEVEDSVICPGSGLPRSCPSL